MDWQILTYLWLDSRLYKNSLGSRGLQVSNSIFCSQCGADFIDWSSSQMSNPVAHSYQTLTAPDTQRVLRQIDTWQYDTRQYDTWHYNITTKWHHNNMPSQQNYITTILHTSKCHHEKKCHLDKMPSRRKCHHNKMPSQQNAITTKGHIRQYVCIFFLLKK